MNILCIFRVCCDCHDFVNCWLVVCYKYYGILLILMRSRCGHATTVKSSVSMQHPFLTALKWDFLTILPTLKFNVLFWEYRCRATCLFHGDLFCTFVYFAFCWCTSTEMDIYSNPAITLWLCWRHVSIVLVLCCLNFRQHGFWLFQWIFLVVLLFVIPFIIIRHCLNDFLSTKL